MDGTPNSCEADGGETAASLRSDPGRRRDYEHAFTALLDQYGRLNLRIQDYDANRRKVPHLGNNKSVSLKDLKQFVKPFDSLSKEKIIKSFKLKGIAPDTIEQRWVGGKIRKTE